MLGLINRLRNKLFGTDFIIYRAKHTSYTFTRKVYTDVLGKVYYKNTIDDFIEIEKPEDVIWVTCKPSKYFKSEDL